MPDIAYFKKIEDGEACDIRPTRQERDYSRDSTDYLPAEYANLIQH